MDGFEGSLDKEGKSCSAIEDLVGLDGRARKSKEVCFAYRCGVGNGRRAPFDDVVDEGDDNVDDCSTGEKGEWVRIAGREGAGDWICGV